MTNFTDDVKEAATHYIEQGYAPIALGHMLKAPKKKDWQNFRMTKEEIDQEFSGKQHNIGIILGNASNGLIDVDLDCAEAVALAPDFLPETDAVYGREGTNFSSHWLYMSNGSPSVEPVKYTDHGNKVIAEVRGDDQQSVVPPSTHPSGEKIKWKRTGKPKAVDQEALKQAVGALCAAVILTKTWPNKGSRHDAALATAGLLLKEGVSEDWVERIIFAAADHAGDEEAEERTKLVLTTKETLDSGEAVNGHAALSEIIGNPAVKKLLAVLGLKAKAGMKPISAIDLMAHDPLVEEMNQEYAFVLIGGSPSIIREEADKRKPHDILTLQGFEKFFDNKIVKVGRRQMTKADLWQHHPKRREYTNYAFEPNGTTPEVYNLYKGFAVEPRQGDCSKILSHMEHMICQGDKEKFQWLLAWCAQLVQQPSVKLGTCVAIRGGKGTGKTTFGKYLGALFGIHYKIVNSPMRITGRFNKFMHDCLLLHSDEGFWAGDKQAEGILKDLVTNDVITVEIKNKEPFVVKNYMRILITTNSEWAVPASNDERRYFVLDMAAKPDNAQEYFSALDHEMNHGGLEAFLYFLLHYDFKAVDLRNPPKTVGLLEQKLESLDSYSRWWMEILQRGYLPCQDEARRHLHEWQGQCSKDDLLHDFQNFVRSPYERNKASLTSLGVNLKKLVSGLKQSTIKVTMVGADGHKNDKKVTSYDFPELEACRAAFEKRLGGKIEWDDLNAPVSAEPM